LCVARGYVEFPCGRCFGAGLVRSSST
ncbi:transposase, partial [Paraburkholderia caribensis]